ncbi:MAG: alcohol dehydrogenase catalytic domain-containing protein, partial [Kiritimatiellota bacterium]|nr:alcohol dehydrogenase catalytic domain-containing protein [Kiritimatiellota bacterium]
MKAIVVESVNRLSVRDVPEPEPNEYQARVKMLAASLCNSTDTKILHGEFAGPLPTVLGHEAVGRVLEVGAKVRHYRVGDLVVRPRIGPIPRLGLGVAFGSFVEIGLVTDKWARAEDEGRAQPWNDQTKADADWDPMTLVQTITLKETLSFLRNLGIRQGDSVLIFGTGP